MGADDYKIFLPTRDREVERNEADYLSYWNRNKCATFHLNDKRVIFKAGEDYKLTQNKIGW